MFKKSVTFLLALTMVFTMAFGLCMTSYAQDGENEEAENTFKSISDSDDDPVMFADESGETVNIEISGEADTVLSSSGNVSVIELDSDYVSYTSASTVTLQAASEVRNGIYFLNGIYLSFYSLDDGSFTKAYMFDGCTSAFVEGRYLYVLYKYNYSCYVYDLDEGELERTVTFDNLSSEDTVTSLYAVGADASGRIYVATGGTADSESIYQVWLYSEDGTLLSSAATDVRIYAFDGFDDSGNFYMETYYNWVYWGYDHPGRAITMGNVTDDEISFVDTSGSVTISGILTYSLNALEYICQSSYYLHQKGADVIGGHYLVTASTTYGRVYVVDTSDDMSTVLYLSRSAIEESQTIINYDLNSIGVRTVYNEANDTIVIYENSKTLNEYDIETGEITGTYETAHYVFNLITMGDYVVAIEKEDGVFYMEIINWAAPVSFTISGSSSMKVGTSQQLSAESSADYELSYEWSSSDPSIVSVTSSGKVSAWKAGTATVSYISPDGKYSASFKIKVSGTAVSTPSSYSVSLNGLISNNISDNNYSTYASIVNSYILQNSDGTFTRAEYTGSEILIETYSSSYTLKSSKTLSMELSYFGGLYSGEDYNYIVYGQSNTSESDSVEVIRVVKYSKSWNRISACSIYGANTYIPFEAGSLRMTELNGSLYIYTCHEMYDIGDGYHHQANMTFVIDEDSMEVTDSYYDIMNYSYGYVSHSFNQFIQTDGEYIYRVDHGDASPRGIYLSRIEEGDSVTDVSYTTVFKILGTSGVNSTGVSIGGFELSDDNCLIVGNSVDMSDSSTYKASGQRNIFLTVTDKDYLTTTQIWLTDYTSSDGVTPRTPELVKISDDQFLIMWEEYYSETGLTLTAMVTVNGDGTQTSDIVYTEVRLSDCQPITTDSGLVIWYVTDGSDTVLYQINSFDLSSYSLDGLCYLSGTWYYFEDGSFASDYTGLASNSSGTWYVEEGIVDFGYTGLIKFDGTWYYIKGSKVASNYTGLASNSAGTWYVENGIVDFGYTGLATVNGTTYYISGNKVSTATGLYKISGTWYYFVSGAVASDFTGVVSNSAGTWYVEDGIVDFSYTGLATVDGVLYYISNSKVSTNTGLYKFNGIWYYFESGAVDYAYTGLVKNSVGWWYVENSIVDFGYTGLVEYNGKYWFVYDSNIKFVTGLYKINGTWYYISNGAWASSYTGLASNSAGTWYVEDGIVDFDYSGTVTINGTKYTIKNSKVTS